MGFLRVYFDKVPLCVLKECRVLEALVDHEDLPQLDYSHTTLLLLFARIIPLMTIHYKHLGRCIPFDHLLVKESEFRVFHSAHYFIENCCPLRLIKGVNQL